MSSISFRIALITDYTILELKKMLIIFEKEDLWFDLFFDARLRLSIQVRVKNIAFGKTHLFIRVVKFIEHITLNSEILIGHSVSKRNLQ